MIFRNISYIKCSYCFVNKKVKVTDGTVVFHIAYNEWADTLLL